MLDQATMQKMTTMRLSAMADAFRQQTESSQYRDLTFEERFGLLVDAEWTNRQQRKLARRLKSAQLRYPASIEDVDFQAPRGLSKQALLSLASCNWIEAKQNVVLTGPTGTGKTFLACALVEKACRTDFSGHYFRAPRLIHDLLVARADGSYTRFLNKLARMDLLAIDDWLLTPLKDMERRDLLEVIEDRSERSATLIATQLPVSAWHTAIGEPTLADGICDRILHRAHRIELKGRSRRAPAAEIKQGTEEEGTTKKKR